MYKRKSSSRMAALSLLSLFLTSQLSIATPVRRHDPLPGGWTAQGCYTDSINPRTLGGPTTSSLNMTTETCVGFCDDNDFIYAGTEFGKECYCANFTAPSAAVADDSSCSIACGGDADEICGGEFALSLLWNGVPRPDPVIVDAVGNWVSLGCFSDNVDGRALTVGPMVLTSPNTIEVCTETCFNASFPFSGTEFSGECYCGTEIQNGGAQAAAADCNMVCTGNPLEFCGGPNRLNVYNYTGDDLPTTQPGGGEGNTPPPPVPVSSGLPTTWAYQSCFVDNANGRVFETVGQGGATNTIESCVAFCNDAGFSVAGTEFADECYCGNRLVNGATPADEADCSMGCAGNATEACGGPNRLSVYASTEEVLIVPVPTAQTTDLPDGWSYAGCFSDDKGNDGRVLPRQIILGTTDSAPNCISACLAADPTITAIGAEFGDECYCGTIEDITTNNSTQRPESECNVVCSGDAASLCGGGFRLQTYTLAAAA